MFESQAQKQATYRRQRKARNAELLELVARARLVIEAARRKGVASEGTNDAEVLERVALLIAGESGAALIETPFPKF